MSEPKKAPEKLPYTTPADRPLLPQHFEGFEYPAPETVITPFSGQLAPEKDQAPDAETDVDVAPAAPANPHPSATQSDPVQPSTDAAVAAE